MITAEKAPAKDIPTIYELMGRVLADLGAVGKTGKNVQQNYSFRGIDSVMSALHPILAKHGVFFTPRMLDRITEEKSTKAGAAMEVVHLLIEFVFYGPAGDHVSCTVWGEASDTADKATNKALSAALKYALVQTFCIPTEDIEDADKTTVERGAVTPPDPRNAVKAAIAQAWAANNITVGEGKAHFTSTHGGDIAQADVATLTAYLNTLAKAVAA